MTAFDDYDCVNCGETYRALDGSNAVATGYCSPRCESDGKRL